MQSTHIYTIYNSFKHNASLFRCKTDKLLYNVIETKANFQKRVYKLIVMVQMRLTGVLSDLWCILCLSYLVCGGVCMFARCVKARRGARRDPAAGAQDPAWFPGALPLALRRSSLRFSGAGASLPALLLQLQLLRSAVMPLKHPLGSAHIAHGAAALCA